MMTSQPPLLYWRPASVAVMHAVTQWRTAGTPVCYTLDAGPNVHVICEPTSADIVASQLGEIPGVTRVLRSGPGGAAHVLD
jgi:diphosphomevalonate decarboxylase